VDECALWTPPATFELTGRDGRLIRYCMYGPRDGLPVVSHRGSPGTRWKRPVSIEAIEQAGLRMLVPDRPGYGGSTRQRGRSVADAAEDAALLADAQGWAQFAVTGSCPRHPSRSRQAPGASLTRHPEVPVRSRSPMDRAVCFPGR
jgi:pimeloyl-ACP methyl ester carboxylesterase